MKRHRKHRTPENVLALRDQYVAVAGPPAGVIVEQESDDRKNDHVWIGISAGEFGRIHVAVSTLSKQSRAAGVDPRVRVGIHSSTWTELPSAGIRLAAGLDYTVLEGKHQLTFTSFDRSTIEQMLVTKAHRAIFIEAWGEFYVRAHLGIHQVHSRRASFAVGRDLIGKDGAIRFYFELPNKSELLMFKFAGQP